MVSLLACREKPRFLAHSAGATQIQAHEAHQLRAANTSYACRTQLIAVGQTLRESRRNHRETLRRRCAALAALPSASPPPTPPPPHTPTSTTRSLPIPSSSIYPRLTSLPLQRLQLHALPADARRRLNHTRVCAVYRLDQRLEQARGHPLAQALRAVLQPKAHQHGLAKPQGTGGTLAYAPFGLP